MNHSIPQNFQLPQNPIFIVGYPRSGTTLIQALLATQENIYSLPETHFFNIINRKAIEIDSLGRVKKKCLSNVSEKIFEKMNLRLTPYDISRFDTLAKKKKLTPKYIFEYLVTLYIQKEVIKTSPDQPFRWVEKTPNHAYFSDIIASFYPDAQFINMIRHPVAAIYSRKLNLPFNEEKPVDWLISRWRKSIEVMEKFSRSHPSKTMTIRYEDLTANLEKECTDISGFINHKFDFNRLKEYPLVLNRLVLSTESWKQKKYQTGIKNTNPHYFNSAVKKSASHIEDQLSDLMDKYHYPTYNGESNEKI